MHNLARQYSRLGQPDNSIEWYEKAIGLGGAAVGTYGNLLTRLRDSVERATQIIDRMATEYPDAPQTLQWRASRAASSFDYESGLRLADSLDRVHGESWANQARFLKASVAVIEGRISDVERYEREASAEWAELPDSMRRRNELLIRLDRAELTVMTLSDPDAASRIIDDALDDIPLTSIPMTGRPYQYLITLASKVGDPDLARMAYEGEVEQLGARGISVSEQEDDLAIGNAHMALAEARYGDAIDAFAAIRSEEDVCSLCFLFEIGYAYDAAGNVDSAIAQYERYVDTDYLGRWTRDAVLLTYMYRRLGELYESDGNAEAAAGYYNRLVELWEDADPELQVVVQDLKGRIARLLGESR
jgi:tetratricopeptide (TPR) repeat protein